VSVRWAELPEHLRDRVRSSIGPVNTKENRKPPKGRSPANDLRDLLLENFSPRYELVFEYRFLRNRKYRIDYAFPAQKVAIEFDGYRNHGFSLDGFRQGLRRQNALVMNGWRVLRYSILDLRDRKEEILAEIDSILRSSPAP